MFWGQTWTRASPKVCVCLRLCQGRQINTHSDHRGARGRWRETARTLCVCVGSLCVVGLYNLPLPSLAAAVVPLCSMSL